MDDVRQALSRCLEKFRSGALTEADLQAAVSLLERPRTQSLLYIQAPTTNPHSRVIGMSIFEEGKDRDGVDATGDFLYKTIKDALDDGWRIVKFPEMTLAMDDQNNYGLGFEYILERWR
jgi:hypothetical protein